MTIHNTKAADIDHEIGARDRIIDAAEHLFAEQGYHAVSLRTVMRMASVNVGAAHYYFGSKKGLLQALFDRRVRQINLRRREEIDRCLSTAKGKASVAKLLEAYIKPALEICGEPGGQLFIRIAALTSIDPSPDVKEIIRTAYDETATIFVQALKGLCPHLTDNDLFWRLNCVYGAMMYIRADNGRIAQVLNSDHTKFDSRTVQEALNHIIPFLAAGFSLPSINSKAK